MPKTFKVPAANGVTGLCARIPQPYEPEPLYALFKQIDGVWIRQTVESFRFQYAHKLFIDKLIRLDSNYKLVEVNDYKTASAKSGKAKCRQATKRFHDRLTYAS